MSSRSCVIITDIGDDMDDAFALCYAVRSTSLDVRGVVVSHGSLQRRKSLALRMLSLLEYSCPVVVALEAEDAGDTRRFSAASWLAQEQQVSVSVEELECPDDPVAFILQVQPQVIICLSPMGVLAALAKASPPEFLQQVRVYAMAGSIRSGYNSRKGAHEEYNVREDAEAAQRVLREFPHVTLAALDVCAPVRVTGRRWKQFLASNHFLLPVYREWLEFQSNHDVAEFEKRSSVLYDIVAVYLATGKAKQINCECLNVSIVDSKTVVDPLGPPVQVATSWKNLAAFLQSFMATLIDRET